MPRWADWLLAAWAIFVAVVYFGALIFPWIGAMTWPLAAVYGIVLLIGVLTYALSRLPRKP